MARLTNVAAVADGRARRSQFEDYRVCRRAIRRRAEWVRPGCARLVTPADAAVAWVGDSRGYLMEGAALRQVTKDHSLVQRLVEIGQITAEEARTHEHKNVITRSLGARQSGPAGAEAVALEAQARRQADALQRRIDGARRWTIRSATSWGAMHDPVRRGARTDRRGQRRRRNRQHLSDCSVCKLGATTRK